MAFRDDHEALGARNEALQRELAKAKERIAELERTPRRMPARPPASAEPAPPPLVGIDALRRAQLMSVAPPTLDDPALAPLDNSAPPNLTAAAMSLVFAALATIALTTFATWAFVAAAIAAIPAIWTGTAAIHSAMNTDFQLTGFETLFFVPFSLMPVVGVFMALWRVVALLRGRFSSCTIESNGDSTCYEARDIGRAGWPLALCFATIAAGHVVVLVAWP